ncbi:MAG: hypothetical protein MJ153_08015 [Clostridia bacterium]|nr:hypothetical protein [Clostridia bacterium]
MSGSPLFFVIPVVFIILLVFIGVSVRKKREAKQRATLATAGKHVVEINKGNVVGFIDENNYFFKYAGGKKPFLDLAELKIDITKIKTFKYISGQNTCLNFLDENNKFLGGISFAWKKDMVAFGDYFKEACAEALAKNAANVSSVESTED